MAEGALTPNASKPNEYPNNDVEETITSAVATLQDLACPSEALPTALKGIPGDQINVGGKGNFAAAHCTFNVTIHHNAPKPSRFQSTSRTVQERREKDPANEVRLKGTESPEVSTPIIEDRVSTNLEERKVVVVAPFGSEIKHESDNGMIVNVWFCWNEGNDYQEILKSEHKHGKIILESYDTFAMHYNGDKPSEDKIQVSISPQESSSWVPEGNGKKEILPRNVCLGKKVRRSFRLKRERPVNDNKDHLYLTLTISQSVSQERREIQFLLRKRTLDLSMTKQMKIALEDGACQLNVKGKTTSAFVCAPFVDVTKEVNDDIILSLWVCPSDDENILFKKLEKEQEIQCKFQLDSPTSFIPSTWNKPISAEIRVHSDQWTIKPSVLQEMEMFTLKNGGRAKFQFLCNAADNLDKTDIDIYLRQPGEDTETEFITTANVSTLKEEFSRSKASPGEKSMTRGEADSPMSLWNWLFGIFGPRSAYADEPVLGAPPQLVNESATFNESAIVAISVVVGVLILADWEHDDESSLTVTLMLCKMSSLEEQLNKLQSSGSLLLDSYDTCILTLNQEYFGKNELTVNYSHGAGTLTTKKVNISDAVLKTGATCTFRCHGDFKAGVYGTLEATASGASLDAPELKQHFTVSEEKLSNLRNMKDQMTSYNLPRGLGENRHICIAVPYIDPIRNISDKVIITVWICSYFRKGEIEKLTNEQENIGRIKLDTENSFLIVSSRKSIEVDVTLPNGWSTDDSTQNIAVERLFEGYRAKAQFICKMSGTEEKNSWADIDITIGQRFEANETQFLTREKLASFFCQPSTDGNTKPSHPQ